MCTYSKHLLTKSMNNGSLQRNTWDNGFVPGFRLRFFELVMQRGLPRESKNNRRRDAWSKTSSGGVFNTSMMQANCSTSFSPGKIGYPEYSSANMHPIYFFRECGFCGIRKLEVISLHVNYTE